MPDDKKPDDQKPESHITGFFKKLLAADRQQDSASIRQATQTPRPIDQILADDSIDDAIRESGTFVKPVNVRQDESNPERPITELSTHVLERIKMMLQKEDDDLPLTNYYAHRSEIEGLVRQKIEALADNEALFKLLPDEREQRTNDILNEAFIFLMRDSQIVHESATIADLHAHPGLKATWFGRKLTVPYDRKNWLQRLFGLREVAFDPTAVRTDFFKLRRGKVNVLFSAVYAFEIEALYNLRITGLPLLPRSIEAIEEARQLPASRIRQLLSGLVVTALLKYTLTYIIFFNSIEFTLLFFALDVLKAALTASLFLAFDNGLQHRKVIPERPLIGLVITLGILVLIPLLMMTYFALPFLAAATIVIFDLLLTLAVFTVAGTLLLQFRLFEPHINRYVLNDDNFESAIGVIRQVEEAVEENTVGDVRSIHSLAEFEVGLKAIRAVKTRREITTGSQVVDEPLLIMHSLEGAHCLHGKVITDHINAIGDLRRKARSARRRGQVERADELDAERKQLDSQLQSEQRFMDEAFDNLYTFYNAGLAIMGLSHYYPNIVCQSTFSYPERIAGHIDEQYWPENWHNLTLGLTPIGKQIVTEMIRIGLLIDISHTSPATRRDIYQLATQLERQYGWRTAIVASHIGVQGLHAHPYNLADWEIIWLAQNNGLIGVMWSNFWLTGHEGLKLGSGYIVQTVNYIIELLERNNIPNPESVVAFGSDLDGLSDPPDDLWDASRWPILTEVLTAQYQYDQQTAMVRYRYTLAELKRFLGGNVIETVCESWGRKHTDAAWNLRQQLGSINNRVARRAAQRLVELGETNLGDIDLRGANLENVDFALLDFDSVHLQGASLFRAKGLTFKKLSKATSLEGTLLPDATKMPGRSIEAFVRGDPPVAWQQAFQKWIEAG